MNSTDKMQYIFASVSKTETARKDLISRNLRTVFISESSATVLPDNFSFDVSVFNALNELSEYDVIEVISVSKFRVRYRNEDSDHVLFITNKCNSNCIMCPMSEFERKKDNTQPSEYTIELIKYIPSDTKFITITGGEPTLEKNDLLRILSACKAHFEDSTKFYFLTNGRTFSNKDYFSALLDSVPENTKFAIPIYGNSTETHDCITNAKGSLRQSTIGIKRILESNFQVEIRIVVSKLNYQNLLNTADYITENFRGICEVNFIGLEMRGNAAKNKDDVWIDYSEAFAASKPAINRLIKDGIKVNLYNFPLCKVERGYWQLCEKSISDYKIQFYESCENCAVKTICGGVFNTTLKLTKMELKPIPEEQQC